MKGEIIDELELLKGSYGAFQLGKDGCIEVDIRMTLDVTSPKYKESIRELNKLLNEFRENKVLKSVSGI